MEPDPLLEALERIETVIERYNTEWLLNDRDGRDALGTLSTALAYASIEPTLNGSLDEQRGQPEPHDTYRALFEQAAGCPYETLRMRAKTSLTDSELAAYGALALYGRR